MLYNLAGIALCLSVLFLLFFSFRLFFSKGWFKAWLKGSVAITAFGAAAGLAAVTYDLYAYTPYKLDHQVAKLSVSKLAAQQYEIHLEREGQAGESYLVDGDLWQLDARVIVWTGFYSLLGMKTSYRLERVSGRYFSLEEEVNKTRTVYELGGVSQPVDLWAFISRNPWVPGIEARYGSGTYVPMSDGATYTIHVRKDGLLTKPSNDAAQKAIYGWK